MSFGIILATHAHIGEALLEGAEMLAGKQDRVKALSLTEDTSVEQFEAQFNASYDTLRQSCDFIVVLCDIYGGSPFNVTSRTLLSGKGNRVVGTQDGHIVDMDMEEALVKTKSFQMDRYQVLEALTNNGGPRGL